ncbi:transporter, partial [Mycobacterium tuberculosis]|nr:transporter [Mycobacterium tuberculosis]
MKYFRKRNGLLGFESLVVTFSATNLMINAFTGKAVFFSISLFCDAFSRGFGVPIIIVAGMMSVTHRYKQSVVGDML